MVWECFVEGRERLGEEMHKNECDWSSGQRYSEENMEELCQKGYEGFGYKGRNGAEPLCLEEYYWGSNPC